MTGLKRAAIVAALAAGLLPAARSASASDAFVVIVNEANPVTHYGRAEVSKLFLKRATQWSNGVVAMPCDLSGTSPIRKAFSETVHGKPPWMIVAFWQQEIASGRNRPPFVCPSDAAAVQAVRESPGGVAYVSEGTLLGPGVKVLAVTP